MRLTKDELFIKLELVISRPSTLGDVRFEAMPVSSMIPAVERYSLTVAARYLTVFTADIDKPVALIRVGMDDGKAKNIWGEREGKFGPHSTLICCKKHLILSNQISAIIGVGVVVHSKDSLARTWSSP